MVYDLVKVNWQDSSMSRNGWIDFDEIEDILDLDIVSVGFLILDGASQIILASSYSEDSSEVGQLITIPKGCITSIEVLEEGA